MSGEPLNRGCRGTTLAELQAKQKSGNPFVAQAFRGTVVLADTLGSFEKSLHFDAEYGEDVTRVLLGSEWRWVYAYRLTGEGESPAKPGEKIRLCECIVGAESGNLTYDKDKYVELEVL